MNKVTLILISALTILVSCTSTPKRQFTTVEGAMLGTTLKIVADVECSAGELYAAAMELDTKFKAEMSLYDPSSQLSRINRYESDSLSAGIKYNIILSDSVSRLSGGAYDITVAPLVKALGFGSKEEQLQKPNIDSILEFVGYTKISIEGDRLVRQDPRTQIDLNSIAKGYVVDRLAELTAQMGAKNYMVDIGGEITCHGTNPYGEPWRIGVESPIDGNMTNGDYIEKRIAIPADSPFRAMATSGNYRRFYLDEEGNKIAHTIDPQTGHSKISSLLSATVIAPTCALADAYGTMFMALGSQDAIAVAETLTNAEVYFIFADTTTEYREYLSEGMRAFVMK
ncbi:MAG: FAD:protein FMN transferase [Rikenellaceae bacterium]